MKGLRKTTALITMAAAFMLLFVLVCPYTPSPLAVVGAGGKLPGAQVAPAVLAVAFILQLAVLVSPAVNARVELAPAPASAPLSDLLCIRLC